MKNKKLYILFHLLATTVAMATDIKRKACMNKCSPNNSRIFFLRKEASRLIMKQAYRAAARLHVRATPSSREPHTHTHTHTHTHRSIGFRK